MFQAIIITLLLFGLESLQSGAKKPCVDQHLNRSPQVYFGRQGMIETLLPHIAFEARKKDEVYCANHRTECIKYNKGFKQNYRVSLSYCLTVNYAMT